MVKSPVKGLEPGSKVGAKPNHHQEFKAKAQVKDRGGSQMVKGLWHLTATAAIGHITVKIDVVKFPFPGRGMWSNTPWAIYYGGKGRTKVKFIGSKDLTVKPWS